MSFLKRIGPGPLIAAAFIGPGTVTLCSIAGVQFGFALLWTLLFAIVATGILQEMSARLGLISQKGLSQIIREQIDSPVAKALAVVLIISAVVVGNAAYEAGNISGAVLGLDGVFGALSLGEGGTNLWALLIGVVAFILLFIGSYKVLERVLVGLVLFMSLAFVITAIMTKPDMGALFSGLLVPSFPEGSGLILIGLIGTTIVPYNLFLHANLVKEKWHNETDLSATKTDTWVAVLLGGLVSMTIIISAAAIQGGDIQNVSDLAKALEPLFGQWSKYFIALGLFAAGITSAVTAPLAAAYVVKGCLGWESDLRDWNFRAVWMIILIIGVVFSLSGFKPIIIIKFAQAANGILLPVVAGFLLWIANKKAVLGTYTNSTLQNILGVAIILITLVLGLKGVFAALGMSLF